MKKNKQTKIETNNKIKHSNEEEEEAIDTYEVRKRAETTIATMTPINSSNSTPNPTSPTDLTKKLEQIEGLVNDITEDLDDVVKRETKIKNILLQKEQEIENLQNSVNQKKKTKFWN